MQTVEFKVRKPYDEYLKELSRRMRDNLFYVPIPDLGSKQALGHLGSKTDLFLIARQNNGGETILLPKKPLLQITTIEEHRKHTWFKAHIK